MDIGNIENYSFIHGLHRNMVNGKWFPLHPHTLGRPLTHSEMDYNLLYSQQTMAGWRIFGQNTDLTLADNELTKSLIFWKISISDTDYDRYVAAGYTSGQYIWITPQYDCNDFYVSNASKTDAIDNCGGFIITLASTTNATPIPDPTATPVPTASPVPTLVPTATPIQPTPTAYSSGSGSGGGAGIPDPTATIRPTATPTPTSGAGAGPTATPISPTATPIIIIPTATPVPAPTATAVLVPTATPNESIRPTATPIIDGRLNYEFIVCFNPEGKAQPNYICTAERLLDAGFTIIPPTPEDTITIEGELNVGAVYVFSSVTPSTDLSLERILTHNIFGCDGIRLPDPGEIRPTATPVPAPTSTSVPVPTATSVPAPTATAIPVPTATAIPVPTATPVPAPTSAPEPTEIEYILPTSTPDSGSGGEGIRPTPTPEDLGDKSYCHYIFVPENIITEGFGLSYILNERQNSLFNQLMAEPAEINGMRGVVYNICSTVQPTYWDSMNNFIMAYPEGVYALPMGGQCVSNFECRYEGNIR
jgi:hypothetical protein